MVVRSEYDYDAAGRRTGQTQLRYVPESIEIDPAYQQIYEAWLAGDRFLPPPPPSYITTPATVVTMQESYTYDAAGRLSQVKDGSNALLASFSYDALGRMTQKNDYQGSVNPLFSQTIAYNAKGQVTSDTVVKLKGGVTYTTAHTHHYTDTNGNYYLGSIARTVTNSSQTGQPSQTVTSTYSYIWREGALQSSITRTLSGQGKEPPRVPA